MPICNLEVIAYMLQQDICILLSGSLRQPVFCAANKGEIFQMERNITETSKAVMVSVSVAKAGSSELRSSCLEGAEPHVHYLNTQDMAFSQRKNEQLSGTTSSQKKKINSRTSLIASLELEGRETRSSVASNTPSATATCSLHRGSFYPKKGSH